MHNNAFDKTKILLVSSIVIAIFFLTMMLLDYANIETATIGAIRGILLIPFFLILLALPVMIFIASRKRKYKNRKTLTYAGIISISTLITIFLMTFS
jgi:uncharacterized membrane protein